MSLDGGPEYPVTTDLSDAASGSLALAEEPLAFDVEAIRADFPILERTVGGAPLIYLDSANSSQKPRVVVEAIEDHYLNHNANVARAMHMLGAEATEAFEGARAQLAQFIGARRSEEVVFTKNASEALNLCAYTLGASLRPGDEIVISVMEHHSNIVPWQLLAERSGAVLRWFDVTDEGRLDLDKAAAEGLINERTKIISVAYVSNVLGTINPISQIAALGHAVRATVVVDASQAVPQLAVNMADLGADLVAFTGHKMVGPTGIGVLWGRYELLAALPPFLGGGEMIEVVTMAGSTYAPPPHRFEAGTPPIAQAVGLAAAAADVEREVDRVPAVGGREPGLVGRRRAHLDRPGDVPPGGLDEPPDLGERRHPDRAGQGVLHLPEHHPSPRDEDPARPARPGPPP